MCGEEGAAPERLFPPSAASDATPSQPALLADASCCSSTSSSHLLPVLRCPAAPTPPPPDTHTRSVRPERTPKSAAAPEPQPGCVFWGILFFFILNPRLLAAADVRRRSHRLRFTPHQGATNPAAPPPANSGRRGILWLRFETSPSCGTWLLNVKDVIKGFVVFFGFFGLICIVFNLLSFDQVCGKNISVIV